MSKKSNDSIQLYLDHGIDIPGRRIELGSFANSECGEAGIDFQMSERIIRGLHLMGKGADPIQLIINSHGGEDDHAVHGVVYGRAESAAGWIFQCCDYRIMDSRSNLMLHMGDSAKTAHTRHIDDMFVEDVLARMREKDPSYPKYKLTKKLHEDWVIYPTQCVELGLADEVI